MFSAGEVIKVDKNSNGQITPQEFQDAVDAAEAKQADDPGLRIEIGGRQYDYANWIAKQSDLRNFYVSESGEAIAPTDEQVTAGKAIVDETFRAALEAEQRFNLANSANPPDNAAVEQAKEQLAELKRQLQQQIRQLENMNLRANKSASDGISTRMYDMAGISPRGEGMKGTFAMTSGGDAGAGTGARAQTTGSIPMGFTPPANWAAQTTMPQFSSDAYMQSMMMEDNVLSSFDSVLKNESKGKQLMMLFFYFARMAESGDLGAMYQFMKFLTYIISKDKSKQQTEMGKKLIELQDLSRQWTDKLLGMQTNSTDPNASNEFMKTMTKVKSETDAIATSQKLISQMMEEFAQIVETLTNATKSALEANGRVLRTVSAMR